MFVFSAPAKGICNVFIFYKTQNLYFLRRASIRLLKNITILEEFWLFWKNVAEFNILLRSATAQILILFLKFKKILKLTTNVKVKVKVTPEQSTKTHRESRSRVARGAVEK